MKNTIYILTLLLLLFSCTKEKSNNSTSNKVTVTGKIVTDCAGTPFANQRFALLNQGNRFLNTGYENVPFTTDTAGNFSVLCNPTGISGFVEIRLGDDGGRAILSFTAPSDLDIGTLNTAPTANYQLKIKVNNTYNVGDTLIILSHNGGGALHKLTAPFQDTIFNSYYNYQNYLEIPTLSNKDKVFIEQDHTIYRYNGATYVEHTTKRTTNHLEGCQNGIQEITVTID